MNFAYAKLAPHTWLGYLDLIYQDNNIFVINKRAGVYSHPNNPKHDVVSVSGLIKDFIDFPSNEDKNKDLIHSLRNGIVHRLDRDTSGLMVLARNEKISKILKKCFKHRRIKKKYQSLIQGKIYQTTTFTDYLIRDPIRRNKRKIVNKNYNEKNKKIATLTISPIEFFKKNTLVEITLITGRTHQIRVQLSYRGYPVVGDILYNRNQKPPLFLCAKELKFDYPKSIISKLLIAENSNKKDNLEKSNLEPQLHFKIDLPEFFQSRLNKERYCEFN